MNFLRWPSLFLVFLEYFWGFGQTKGWFLIILWTLWKNFILLSKFTNMWERKCEISVFQIKAILFWIFVCFNILLFVSFTLPCFIKPEVLLLNDATVWLAKLDWAEVCYFGFFVYLSPSSPIMFLLNHSTASLCLRKRENLQLCSSFFFPQRAYA